MLKSYLTLAAMTALLTAVPTVAQPQTTTDAGTMDTTSQTGEPVTSPGTTSTGTATDTTSTTTTPSGSATSSATGATTSSSATDADAATGQAGTSATASTGAAGTGQLQGQDATFLRKAIEGDRKEIASAQAALDNAQRSDTKNAARMILEDHQKSNQTLEALAKRKGWTLPAASDAAESDQALMGAAGSGSFDDRFTAEQIRMHREAISLYRAQASGGSDPDLRQFARDQLPHLEHHLEMLQGSNTQK